MCIPVLECPSTHYSQCSIYQSTVLFSFSGGWCMVVVVIYPHNAVIFGPGGYEIVLEMGPVVWLNSFWGVMSPQYFLFKAQDSISVSGMGHRICFQPYGGCFHHCKHVALTMMGLWECDIIHPPGLPVFIFQLSSSSIPKRFYLLGLLRYSTFHFHG